MPPTVDSNLIYDVGLFDGGDTAYYLFRGYKVVAIDANPLMIEKAQRRFAREIEAGRLTLLNVGVSDTPGTATFWVSELPEWSSFDKKIASRDGTAHTPVSVSVLPFSRILEENGIPHYLKIDIEGNDRLCVDAMKGTKPIPQFISVESECVGDSGVLTEEEAIAMLLLLRDLGYRRFKLVNQKGWGSARSAGIADFWTRLVTSAASGRFKVQGISTIAEKFTDSARVARLGFDFTEGSSGPWGDDIPGSWMTFDEAKDTYLRLRRQFFSRKRPLYSFWQDWHATY